jgi:hypothetical protein
MMTTPPLGLSFPWPHGRPPPSPLFLPGGPSTVPGHGGVLFVLAGFGVGCGVARGVGAGVTRGVGAGVAVGGWVGFVLGGLVDPAAVGCADGARGPMATWPPGSGVTEGPTLADGWVDGGGVDGPGEPSGGVVA